MKFVMKNIFILTILCFCSIFSFGENRNTKNVITHVTVTCYQPVKEQCDDNPLITADGSKIDLHKLKQGKIKWCAISRDLLWLFPKDKPKRVHIHGYGIYEVRDVMNKRFNHRVDILLHPSDKTLIFDEKIKMTILH
jgi:3D (Asp-Asp-Asp) domain-containing protein